MADFGLAINEAVQPPGRRGRRHADLHGPRAGPRRDPPPRRPHRLWALGVILYQGLTGRLPFAGRDRAALFDEILAPRPEAPAPGRRRDPGGAGADLPEVPVQADDRPLRHGARTSPRTSGPGSPRPSPGRPPGRAGPRGRPRPPVVPKGCGRSTARTPTSSWPSCPAPADRDGLPESIRFWKARIEDRDRRRRRSASACSTGPSGGGKSSLVRAGLLPRLDRQHRGRSTSRPRPTAPRPRLLAGAPPACPGPARRRRAWSSRGRAPRGSARRRPDEDPARPRPVRAVAPRPPGRRRGRAGPRPPPVRRRPAPGARPGPRRLLDGRRPGSSRRARGPAWSRGPTPRPSSCSTPRTPGGVLERFGRACNRLTGPDGDPSAEEADASSTRPSPAGRPRRPGHPGPPEPLRRGRPADALDPATLEGPRRGIEGIGVTFLEEAFDLAVGPALLPGATARRREADPPGACCPPRRRTSGGPRDRRPSCAGVGIRRPAGGVRRGGADPRLAPPPDLARGRTRGRPASRGRDRVISSRTTTSSARSASGWSASRGPPDRAAPASAWPRSPRCGPGGRRRGGCPR